jgi:hypothetical protein
LMLETWLEMDRLIQLISNDHAMMTLVVVLCGLLAAPSILVPMVRVCGVCK